MSARLAALLHDSILSWSEQLDNIKTPNAEIWEEIALLRERSRKTLEQWSFDREGEELLAIQQSILEDGGRIRDLELKHTATIKDAEALHSQELKSLVGKICEDLICAFGDSAVRESLRTCSAGEGSGKNSMRPVDQACYHASKEWQFGPDGPNSPLADSSSSKASHKASVEYENTIERRNHSLSTTSVGHKRVYEDISTSDIQECDRIAEDETKAPDQREWNQNRASTPESQLYLWDTHKHTNAQKSKIRRSGSSLEKKTIELGESGHTAAILIYANPTCRRWVCAAYVPGDKNLPDLNRIVRDHLQAQTIFVHQASNRSLGTDFISYKQAAISMRASDG